MKRRYLARLPSAHLVDISRVAAHFARVRHSEPQIWFETAHHFRNPRSYKKCVTLASNRTTLISFRHPAAVHAPHDFQVLRACKSTSRHGLRVAAVHAKIVICHQRTISKRIQQTRKSEQRSRTDMHAREGARRAQRRTATHPRVLAHVTRAGRPRRSAAESFERVRVELKTSVTNAHTSEARSSAALL